MTEPKKPQDHKPKKKTLDDVPAAFEFTHEGETYAFKPTADHLTPGFLRKNRRRDEFDATYTIIETLAPDDVLDVIDNMSWKEHSELQEAFGDYFQEFMGASVGESTAS